MITCIRCSAADSSNVGISVAFIIAPIPVVGQFCISKPFAKVLPVRLAELRSSSIGRASRQRSGFGASALGILLRGGGEFSSPPGWRRQVSRRVAGLAEKQFADSQTVWFRRRDSGTC